MALSHVVQMMEAAHDMFRGALDVFLSRDVEKAREIAREGDIVSLSPACASFDLYPDFEARGRHFKELVNKL